MSVTEYLSFLNASEFALHPYQVSSYLISMIEKSLKSESFSGSRSPNHSSSMNVDTGADSRLFEVVIAGVPLRLKSAHDNQTVNELVAYVDQKVREALPLTKTGSIQNAAILASLNLAEEFILLKRKAKLELENLEAKAQKVISELESSRVNTGLNNT